MALKGRHGNTEALGNARQCITTGYRILCAALLLTPGDQRAGRRMGEEPVSDPPVNRPCHFLLVAASSELLGFCRIRDKTGFNQDRGDVRRLQHCKTGLFYSFLMQAGHAIKAVATVNPDIAAWAQAKGIKSVSMQDAAHLALPGIDFDYLFSVANLEMLPASLISRAGKLAINFHDSLLPQYAGLNATAWALMAGEKAHGITWHEMTALVDAGRGEVVDELDFVAGVEILHCFEFDDQLRVDHDVRNKVSHYLVLVVNFELFLPLELDACGFEFNSE